MSHRYLDSHFPPVPALEIWMGYPDGELSVGPVVAIADTGADGTLVPQSLLDQVNKFRLLFDGPAQQIHVMDR